MTPPKVIARALVRLSEEVPSAQHPDLARAAVDLLGRRSASLLQSLRRHVVFELRSRGKAGQVEIASPSAPLRADIAGLKRVMQETTSRELSFNERQEAALLGGVVVAHGDERYDGSLRAVLDSVERRLAAPLSTPSPSRP